jgi:nucleoside-diphosphate-sugar epimerase
VDARTSARPTTPYGISKLEAERELADVAQARDLSWIALRPPLVIGEGVGGNVARMIRWIARGLPLPAVHNRRSTIYVGNLADAVVAVLAPGAPEAVAVPITDGPPHSTAALARAIGAALQRSPHLLPVPEQWLELGARALGRAALWRRLCGDLEISQTSAAILRWTPRVPFFEAVRRAVHATSEPARERAAG